ncbi:MAG TPA: hypothetical protein VGM25_13830 [Caulobacteraceae bacterium]|jgi:hypothetical protein
MTPLLLIAALGGSPSTPIIQANPYTAACATLATQTVGPDGVPFKKLNELPWGVLEHAVWRTVGGCPVREVIWRNHPYYVGPSIPRLENGPDTVDRTQRRTRYFTPPGQAPNLSGKF